MEVKGDTNMFLGGPHKGRGSKYRGPFKLEKMWKQRYVIFYVVHGYYTADILNMPEYIFKWMYLCSHSETLWPFFYWSWKSNTNWPRQSREKKWRTNIRHLHILEQTAKGGCLFTLYHFDVLWLLYSEDRWRKMSYNKNNNGCTEESWSRTTHAIVLKYMLGRELFCILYD